jgi:hypothetical protein
VSPTGAYLLFVENKMDGQLSGQIQHWKRSCFVEQRGLWRLTMTYAFTSASFSGRTGAAAVFHLEMLRRGAIAHSSQGGNEVVEND